MLEAVDVLDSLGDKEYVGEPVVVFDTLDEPVSVSDCLLL